MNPHHPKEALARLGLAPSKARSQNFLSDRSVAGRLASFIYEKAPGPVVEIGPGLGALTRPLLALGAEVTAIELDRGLAADLRRWPEAESGQLAVIEKDVLKVDLESSLGPGPLMVCGNLPYNISTPLLFWYTRQAKTAPVGVFMLQKEVAERLCAAPGGRDYGRLTVAVSLWHEVRLVFEVPSAAFSPRPKVKSAVVCLTPVPDGPTISREALGRLTMAAFHARRKTIFNNLSAVYGRLPASEALEKLGLAAEVRAETLPPQTLAALAALLEKSDPGAASGGDEIAGFNLTGGQTTD